jgi:ligand-binding SRPBCC domain-containing protein
MHIHLETLIAAPVEIVFDLARDLDFHTRSMAHTGEHIVGGRRGGLIELGEEVEWEARHFGLALRLRSRITAFDRPHAFTDEQVRGPFSHFEHRHTFFAEDDGTRMVDDWTHTAPLGPLGWTADRIFLASYMRRLLLTRNAALRAEAEGR